ncbi:proteasome subunit alpha [candidate division MSBL1 archaeon SCGC-AAA261G05]|uniref:Proteasome subunit alpha n=3 Tax=candidate division MSBL1 TaxID=215777 RepID=A0A133V1F3_9EURY|nr:proteasome subunit alpha [candidate division MSBL1 archaeon SCGC-AAA261C02]KXB04162.1 proteasome subunit alpha [candidate division MSBL1 archaeon SCGC-AAA261G05]KXB04379.1 proteasome subunit alpha [candidate division MSBL1 archaeon SCGC-AAA261O19]
MAFVGRGRGYDRAITVFSPDGKLFQVQYAQEAVKRGYTALGVKVNSGVVLAAERRSPSKLVEDGSVEKIFQVDDHIGAGASGLIADARVLIDRARIEAQVNRMRYDEPIPVETLSRSIGDIKQMYTQHGGVRPFGTRFLIGGVDANGPQLYETDPSGVVAAYKAHAIGGGAAGAIEVLESRYEEDASLDDAISLALDALKTVIEGKLGSDKVEMTIIPAETEEFEKLSKDKVDEYIKKAG